MTIETVRVGQINILNKEEDRNERYSRLMRHLLINSIDVVTLQEVSDTKALANKLYSNGYPYSLWGTPFTNEGDPEPDSVGIASKFPLEYLGEIEFEDQRNALLARIKIGKNNIFLCSSHFAWGSFAEGMRLHQAELIEEKAKNLTANDDYSFFILGADLNTPDDSRTFRFFKGLDLGSQGQSTYWTDAHQVSGNSKNYITSDQGKGILGPTTAQRFGVILPELLPARRIDYLLSRGWRYGKPGCPINFDRFGDPLPDETIELSDHYGIWADFLLHA